MPAMNNKESGSTSKALSLSLFWLWRKFANGPAVKPVRHAADFVNLDTLSVHLTTKRGCIQVLIDVTGMSDSAVGVQIAGEDRKMLHRLLQPRK